jgi:sugar phosphate isomerase/epimerase
MNHAYSLAYLTVPSLTPPQQTYVAAKAGYDMVSYRLIHLNVAGEPDINPTSPEMIRETKRALADTGLQCFDIELARILRGLEPATFLPAFEAGAELGAHQFICSAWTDVRNDRSFIVERFAEICELAAPFGLTVNLEFPAFSRLTSLEDALEVQELAGCANQGLLVDTLYLHFNKTPLAQLQRIPDKWMNFLHICDADDLPYTRDQMIHVAREDRLYPGEGAVDFAAIGSLFPDLPLTIELPNASRTAALGDEQHARNCLQAAKRVFEPETPFSTGVA